MNLVIRPSVFVGTNRPLQATAPAAGGAEAATITDAVTLSGAPAVNQVPTLKVALASALGLTPGALSTALICLTISGPPGAGKSTHGDNLAAALGIPHISMGSLLRAEKAAGHLDPETVAAMEKGDLVRSEVVAAVLEKRLLQPDASHGFILDGFPRRPEDVTVLRQLTQKLKLPPVPMIFLDVKADEVVRRVENRRECDQGHLYDLKNNPPHNKDGVCDIDGTQLHRRSDDDPAVVAHRMEVYRTETEPVLNLFRQENLLYAVDGSGTVADVGKRVDEAVIRSIEEHYMSTALK